MMRWLWIVLMAMPAHADTLVATRNLRAQSIIAPGDITIVAADVPGALDDPAQAVGQEVRVSLYAGRPLRPGDIGPPTVVDRNQIVALAYSVGPLTIQTEGRALARGGVGDVIRIMNLASRTTVSGRVLPDGSVAVGPNN